MVGGCRQGPKDRDIEGLTASSCSSPPLVAFSLQNGGWPYQGAGGHSGWGHRVWLAANPDQLGLAGASKTLFLDRPWSLRGDDGGRGVGVMARAGGGAIGDNK